ncbi:MAG: DUF4405 domain-containing protein [Candidatus Woesearchaeota archaeon]
MKKSEINYFIDIILIFLLIITSISGFIIFFFFPHGVRQGKYQLFLGISKETYSQIHNWSGLVFSILMFLHVVLHWKWIYLTSKSMIKNIKKKDNDL